jgi:hypothetical protein
MPVYLKAKGKIMADIDKAVREHVLYLLKGGGAHAKLDEAIADIPVNIRGQKAPGLPHTLWMLLEHMRIAQWDILDFSRNPKYKPLAWPEGYWPKTEAPPSPAAWDEGINSFHSDLDAMQELVANPKSDIYRRIPWGEGQTILREALLIADHNAYHLAQIVDVRRALGAWA